MVLENRGVDHSERAEDEGEENALRGWEGEVVAGEVGVEELERGGEEGAGEAGEGLREVVG